MNIKYSPDYAVHPGEVIREMREGAGMKQSHLAGMCQVSPKHMCQIELGKAPLRAQLAVQIELALAQPVALVLMRMQANYDVHAERRKVRERLRSQAALLDSYPPEEDQT